MKKNFFSTLWFAALCMIVFGIGTGCEPENTVYEGDYTIASIADLKALSGYTEVTGDLNIGRYNLASYFEGMEVIKDQPSQIDDFLKSLGLFKNLDGLESLKTVGGSLRIGYPGYMDIFKSIPSLENIDGLCNLESVGGSIIFYGTNNLKNLDGFRSLKTVGGGLLIGYYAPTNLDGLSNLTSIGGTLSLTGQPALTNMKGLNHLTTVGGLQISNNDQLESLDGLANLTAINGILAIQNNPALKNISGLADLTSIGQSLRIRSNPVLETITGLSNLQDIGVDGAGNGLIVIDNPTLTDLDWLDGVINLVGNISMCGNSEAADSQRDVFKDRITAEGWDGCWDFTCDDYNNPVCPSAQ